VRALAALRRVLTGEGLAPRLLASTTKLRFGECIIRDASLPYTQTLSLTNSDSAPLAFQLDAAALAGGPFSIDTLAATLPARGSVTLNVSCIPRAAGQCLVHVPIYISDPEAGDANAPTVRTDRAYLTLTLGAKAATPRLVYDRPEVVLPTVPLGMQARAAFYVINEGYDNLQIDYRLPADTVRMPLQLRFPEGRLVGYSRKKLLLLVTFAAKKPMSFTAKIELLDMEGNRFPINVTATADNSLLTLQPYLSLKAGQITISAEEGKPPTLVDEEETARAASLASTPSKKKDDKGGAHLGGADDEVLPLAKAALEPAMLAEESLSAVAAETARSAQMMMAYISAAIVKLSGGEHGFPAPLLHPRAKPLVDLVALLSGKNLSMPPPTVRICARSRTTYTRSSSRCSTFCARRARCWAACGPTI